MIPFSNISAPGQGNWPATVTTAPVSSPIPLPSNFTPAGSAAIPYDFWVQELTQQQPPLNAIANPPPPTAAIVMPPTYTTPPTTAPATEGLHFNFPMAALQAVQQHQQHVITVQMQYGWQRELVVVVRTDDPAAFELFRKKAVQIVERQHQLPDGSVPNGSLDSFGGRKGSFDVQLYFHDYKNANLLSQLVTLSQLDNGSVVEVIRIDRNTNDRPARPHSFDVSTYRTPTFCDYCGEILLGLIKQGLTCKDCKLNFHKRCAHAPRNECAKWGPQHANSFLAPNPITAESGMEAMQIQPQSTPLPPQYQLPHTLTVHSYKTPTVCRVCDKLLVGLLKQGLKCRDCKLHFQRRYRGDQISRTFCSPCTRIYEMHYQSARLKVNVHKKCAAQLPSNCHVPDSGGSGGERNLTPALGHMSVSESPQMSGLQDEKWPNSMDLTHCELPAAEDMDTMIPLARLPGSASARSTINQRAAPLYEGWLIHFELQQAISPTSYELNDIRRLRHYWVLTADGVLTLYNEYNDGVNPYRAYRSIQIAEILSITTYQAQPLDPKYPAHCFEIRTADSTYCVGENLDAYASPCTGRLTSSRPPSNAARAGNLSNQWQTWFTKTKAPPKIAGKAPGQTQPPRRSTRRRNASAVVDRDGLDGSDAVNGNVPEQVLPVKRPKKRSTNTTTTTNRAVPQYASEATTHVGNGVAPIENGRTANGRVLPSAGPGAASAGGARARLVRELPASEAVRIMVLDEESEALPSASNAPLHQSAGKPVALRIPAATTKRGSLANQMRKHVAALWLEKLETLKAAWQPPKARTAAQNADPALRISEFYQVRHDAVLGSGQFGTVYSAVHRQTMREVAVKIIQKDRFTKKSTTSGIETLKSEVAILQAVDHHGIIKLESMYETSDKIYVVMEKMNGDMLEMILSQAAGRLNERCTKFLLIQILQALRYLHARDIAHCDLKPENVLLDRFESNFPQTKLCDFGYARFIGESQFRKTIVGTPAYLAPEVLKKEGKGYNKSLDIWSVGVILYVTLSGTFPFNEGEEIAKQIQNASFMFPSDPWREIDPAAVDLIQSLLRVEIEDRIPVERCLQHPWLRDTRVVEDLRALEDRLGAGHYLTE